MLQKKLTEAKRLRTKIINSVYPSDAVPYSDGLVDGIQSVIYARQALQAADVQASTTEEKGEQ